MAANLSVEILSSFNSKGIDDAQRSTGRLSSTMGKLGGALKIGAVAGMGALAAGAVAAVKAGSDLQQSFGAIESTFGSATDEIRKFGESSATSVGLSTSKFNELAAVSGSMLKNLGFSASEAATATEDLSVRAADLAATFGGSTADAMNAMNAALRGEFDSLERYGVKLSQTDVAQKAVAMGLASSTSAVDKHAQAQAAMALIMEQSADKAGTFADESNTFAGQWQILSAQFSNVIAQIGSALLPILEQLMSAISTVLVPAIQSAADWFTNLIGSFTSTGASATQLTGFVDTLRAAWDTLAPSVMNIITYVADLAKQLWSDLQPAIAAVADFVTNVLIPGWVSLADTFMTSVWPAIQELVTALQPLFQWLAGKVLPIVVKLYGQVFPTFVNILRAVMQAIGAVIRIIAQIVSAFTRVASVVAGAVQSAIRGATNAFNTIRNAIRTVASVLSGPMNAAFRTFKSIVSSASGTIRRVAGAVRSALGGAFRSVLGPIRSVVGAIRSIIGAARSAINAISRIKVPGSGIIGAIGGLFKSGRSAGPMGRAAAPPMGRAGVTTNTIVVRSQVNPQLLAREISSLMTGARVRTGFNGVRL